MDTGKEVSNDIQIATEVLGIDAHIGEHKKVSKDAGKSFSLWSF